MTKFIPKLLLTCLLVFSILVVSVKPIFALDPKSAALGSGSARGFSDIVILDFLNLFAEDLQLDKADSEIGKALIDFCKARSGDTMNLETWYSGTCTSTEKANAKKTSMTPMGTLGSLMAGMYANPPASTAQYVAYIGQNIQNKHLVSPAYAQSAGFGFTRLSPLLKFWSLLRNTAYAFFVLVFVLYGFMIMFRVNIAPRVALSIQTAIPKLVMVLLMITFSYAIAGFLVDLSYLGGLLTVNILDRAEVLHLDILDVDDLPLGLGKLVDKNPDSQRDIGFALMDPQSIITGEGFGVIALSLTFLKNFLTGMSLPRMEAVLLGVPDYLTTLAFGWNINFLIAIIIVLGLFVSLLKTLFMMIGAYIRVILLIAFSPIIILMDAIPARKSSAFVGWIRNLIANLSVFPVVLILVMLAVSLLSGDSSFIQRNDTKIWAPPVFSSNEQGIAALIGLGLLFMTSKFADMIRNALQIREGIQYGRTLGEGLEMGYGIVASQHEKSKTGTRAGLVPTIPGAGKVSTYANQALDIATSLRPPKSRGSSDPTKW